MQQVLKDRLSVKYDCRSQRAVAMRGCAGDGDAQVGLGLDVVGKEPVGRDGHRVGHSCAGGGLGAALGSQAGFTQPDANPVAAY